MKESLLSIQNLHLQFQTSQGSVQAIRGVNLDVRKGEIVGLVGESGCGKSVTAHAILQLLNSHHRISGHIFFEDQDLLIKSDKEMRLVRGEKIGMIFQDPLSALNPTLSIGYQLMEGLRKHKKLSKDEAFKQALYWLQQVGISDAKQRMQQYPHEFSGGMRQRVFIAMSIACQPLLLIADEPTTALDVTVQAQILNLLQEIRGKHQMSLLLITHDLGVVAHLCDRVYVMYAGQIVEHGPIDALFYHPQHPYTQALLKSKCSLSQNKNQLLFSIQGQPPSLLSPLKGCSFSPRCPQAIDKCREHSPLLNTTCSLSHQTACWLTSNREQ
jgi:oligopeptide transport system ATP-binding protein